MENPDVMSEINESVLTEAASLLSQCCEALNCEDHGAAESILTEFDHKLSGEKLVLDLIYHRLRIGSELYFRLGKYKEGIISINANISSISTNIKHTIDILICKGKMELMLNRSGISTSAYSQALALAESLGDMEIIGIVYLEISRMFSTKYYGLAIYFARKAEISYERSGLSTMSSYAKIDRALISYNAYLSNRTDESFLPLKKEAERIVHGIDDSLFDKFKKRHLRFVKSYISNDKSDLRQQIREAEESNVLPSICTMLEAYIAACIESGDHKAALLEFDNYAKYMEMSHGPDVKKHMAELKYLLESQQNIIFIPWHLSKDTGEQTNLFDILDHFSLGEELWRYKQGRYAGLFPGIEQEGLFEMMRMPDGNFSLVPYSPAFNDYYRGQNTYFEDCHPSLYRKEMTPAMQFVERVKYEELKFLIAEYPLAKIFSEELHLNVDVLALAQHYGIKTELMDITVDKFTAAFFASTECDADGNYRPVTTVREKPGVFYLYVENLPFINSFTERKLRAVGLQPFSRPGEQAGFTITMTPEQNFNNMVCQGILFYHNPEIAEFIFNYTNRSAKLFPKSILEGKANIIKNSPKLSRAAFDAACNEFYPSVDTGICLNYMKECNKELTEYPVTSFTEQEKSDCIKQWQETDFKEMQKRTIVRLVYNP